MTEREIVIQDKEKISKPTHIITTEKPKGERDLTAFFLITDPEFFTSQLTDAANFPGGNAPGLFRVEAHAKCRDIAEIVTYAAQDKKGIVTIGMQSSLTGAAVPEDSYLLDMTQLKHISEVQKTTHGDTVVTVQPGVTFHELAHNLHEQGLFLPAAPTYEEATIGGGVSTDAGGARSYKYGKIRNAVMGVEMLLPNGEVLRVKRGETSAHPPTKEYMGGYFELENAEGERTTVPVPTYTMPDVPKSSVGYYAQPAMDFVDLLVGSEGTLGVITAVDLKVIPEPPTTMALVVCDTDEQAFALNARLRGQEADKRISGEPGGISAVEFMGANARNLAQECRSDVPGVKGNALLLVQIETPDAEMTSVGEFLENCEKVGISVDDENRIFGATPDDTATKERFIALRESIPQAVNELLARYGLTKVAGDYCVSPDKLTEMNEIVAQEGNGQPCFYWGHGEGNLHYNFLPATEEDRRSCVVSLVKAGRRIITELNGVGSAEHGIGKNAVKQELLYALRGDTGIDEMREVKRAFDPHGMMAKGNIFPHAS